LFKEFRLETNIPNIEATLKKGDEKTAVELWNALSDTKKADILAKPKD